MKSPIKIGTRGSPLALYQAELIRAKLKVSYPLVEFELVKIHTKGDMIRRGSVAQIGERIFTHEIEQALLKKEIDLGVHSAKDLAAVLPEGLELAAVSEREDSRDCLVARNKMILNQLSPGAKVGTSSLRRKAQIRKLRSDLEIIEIRGNVETRLRKVKEGACDAVALAYAGLRRLGLSNKASQIFDEDEILPQAGQGIIGVEIRSNDSEMKEFVRPINHQLTYFRALAERGFLARLQGGCQVPVGVSSKIEGNLLFMRGAIFSLEGDRSVSDTASGALDQPAGVGIILAEKLLSQGGREILESIRKGTR